MITVLCDRWVNVEAGTRCQLIDGHDGPCREISWAELQAMDDDEGDEA